MKIAIIGSGIAGLGAAYMLHARHEITVYEKAAHIGGATRTVYVRDGGRSLPIDTGFSIFNYRNYPLLTGLFEHLKVPMVRSDISFSASIHDGALQFKTGKLFLQKKNLLNSQFRTFAADIKKFNKASFLEGEPAPGITLARHLDQLDVGDWFRRYYLKGLGEALWRTPFASLLKMPAQTFVRPFRNHALLAEEVHPHFYVVKGGCREYISRLIENFSSHVKTECGVKKVRREGDKIYLTDQKNNTEDFDQVIFACPADEALALLENPTEEEKQILGAFEYEETQIVVHKDTSLLPKEKENWGSWNYLIEDDENGREQATVTNWLNPIQNLETENPILLSLNPGRAPEQNLVQDRHSFRYVQITLEAMQAQKRLDELQGMHNTWYCGAYHKYGSHEDGLASAVKVCNKIGVPTVWKQTKV